MAYRHTGSSVDFDGTAGYNSKDTSSTIEFKKAMRLHKFLNNPFNKDLKNSLKEYCTFYTLKANFDSELISDIEIYSHNPKKKLVCGFHRTFKKIDLPEGKYSIKYSRKKWIFWKTEHRKRFALISDKQISLE